MKILVVGSGGREHALAWKIAQSPRVHKVFVAPGNGGTALDPDIENIDIHDIDELADFARHNAIHLTVVGPEAPLAAGLVDVFHARGLRVFGPCRQAAQLESSKDFAKAFMVRHGIPTARYQTFDNLEQACIYIRQHGAPIVIKADGLAAGKGVVIAQREQQAIETVEHMLVDNTLGSAGARVVIEEYLDGEEASFMVVADGEHSLALATSQDHKRLLDADRGPNTGGMGAYSPAPVVTPAIHAKVMREVIGPAIAGMAQDGIPYTGFLYAGLMIDAQGGVKVLEFNCRLGDPETQPIMMRLKSDLIDLLDHAVDGALDRVTAEWDRRTALGVVAAAQAYPNAHRTGDIIKIDPVKPEEGMIFHAGTRYEQGRLTTSGGRVLCATALGDNPKIAQKQAYELLQKVQFEGMQFRTDIGHRAINRQ